MFPRFKFRLLLLITFFAELGKSFLTTRPEPRKCVLFAKPLDNDSRQEERLQKVLAQYVDPPPSPFPQFTIY